MDVRENKVRLSDGTEISYDKCLIATGKKKPSHVHTHTHTVVDVNVCVCVCGRWGSQEPAGN